MRSNSLRNNGISHLYIRCKLVFILSEVGEFWCKLASASTLLLTYDAGACYSSNKLERSTYSPAFELSSFGAHAGWV